MAPGKLAAGSAAAVLVGLFAAPPARAARAGSAQQVFAQAVDADLGKNQPSDAVRAFVLYRRAAELGLPEAELNVAVMYDAGRGVAHDSRQAATWYAAAASGGVARAGFDLGQLYEAGDGVPRNLELARAWFRQAAEHGLKAAAGRGWNQTQPPGSTVDVPAISFPGPKADLHDAATAGVPLVWTAAPTPAPASYFVEVVRLDSGEPTQVFSQTTNLSASRMPNPGLGSYAWRVYVICPSLGRYVSSSWVQFSVS